MSRRAITSLVFGQLGRFVSGHPFGCGCAQCGELDGDASKLVELFERAAAPDAPSTAPIKVDVREVRPVRKGLPTPSKALPVAAEVDGQAVRAELVLKAPSKPRAKRARR